MRLSSNPAKTGPSLSAFGTSRLIVPVYLPSLDGYFAEGLAVLERMLDSIDATGGQSTLLTVIDNASAPEVGHWLDQQHADGRLDRLVRNSQNRGKVDAVLAELRATFETVAVVADADVVFRPGWEDGVLAAFAAFPECGMLGLHPAPSLRWHASSSILATASLAGAHLRRARLVDPNDLDRFEQSVGRAGASRRSDQLIVERDGAALALGIAHFAFAMRTDVVADLPAEPSLSTANGVDADHLELPADRAGWWCASVLTALVHHVGNSLGADEDERIAEFAALRIGDGHGGLSGARRARLARWLPAPLRRATLRIGRGVYAHPGLLDRLLPVNDLAKQPGTAIGVTAHPPKDRLAPTGPAFDTSVDGRTA